MQTSASRQQHCIESLARHVLHDAYRESALLSTHLVAFLLLNKHPKGTTTDQLAVDLDWLRRVIGHEKRQSLSIIGDSRELIRQAQFYLSKELLVTEKVLMKWSTGGWNHRWPYHHQPVNGCKKTNVPGGSGRLHHDQNDHLMMDDSDDNHFDLAESDSMTNGGSPKSQVEIVYLKPVMKLNSVLQLHHYANTCTALFQLDSVFGNRWDLG